MSDISENGVTAVLTFKVPQKVGWSVQRGDQSWTGKEFATLVNCLTQERDRSVTLSLSLIFEIDGNGGTVRT